MQLNIHIHIRSTIPVNWIKNNPCSGSNLLNKFKLLRCINCITQTLGLWAIRIKEKHIIIPCSTKQPDTSCQNVMPKTTSFQLCHLNFQENQIHTPVVKIKHKHCVAAAIIYFQEKAGINRFHEKSWCENTWKKVNQKSDYTMACT